MNTLIRCESRAAASFAAGSCIAKRRAFTLIEILIIVVILGILAAMVFPPYSSLVAESRAKSAASNVQKVREMIEIHSNSGDYPVAPSGHPDDIYSTWFTRDVLPENPWAGEPIVVDVVAAGAADRYPAVKIFDPDTPGADSAWYNTDNGCFAILVPAQNNDAETLALFNLANTADLGNLGETQ
jgi:general secretion pathway protein G